jgi:hypothetical protein
MMIKISPVMQAGNILGIVRETIHITMFLAVNAIHHCKIAKKRMVIYPVIKVVAVVFDAGNKH